MVLIKLDRMDTAALSSNTKLSFSSSFRNISWIITFFVQSYLMAFYLSQSQGQVLTGLILGLTPWGPLLTLCFLTFYSHPHSLHSNHPASSLTDFIVCLPYPPLAGKLHKVRMFFFFLFLFYLLLYP